MDDSSVVHEQVNGADSQALSHMKVGVAAAVRAMRCNCVRLCATESRLCVVRRPLCRAIAGVSVLGVVCDTVLLLLYGTVP